MKHLKIIIFMLNFLMWLSGFLVIVIGTWQRLEPTSGHLLNLFVRNLTPHVTAHILPYSLLGIGFLVFTVGFFGCRVSLRGSQGLLIIYIIMLMILIVVELATTAVGGFLSFRAISGLEKRLLEKLSEHYGHDRMSDIDFSHSLDFAQYKFNCCGIYGDSDYNGTVWWRDGRLTGHKRHVPLTCCVLKNHETKNSGSPMSVVTRVFHKDYEVPWLQPQPKDEAACEAIDPEIHVNYRNKKGCLEQATSWLSNESWKLVFLAVAMASIQTFVIITSAILYRTIRDMQDD